MNCLDCGKELSGGPDTFGVPGLEKCWDCWSVFGDYPAVEHGSDDIIYGLGPHIHAFDPDGRIIPGGTEFLSPPGKPDENGLYFIPKDYPGFVYHYFLPDPEAPGLGTWFKNSSAVSYFYYTGGADA